MEQQLARATKEEFVAAVNDEVTGVNARLIQMVMWFYLIQTVTTLPLLVVVD